MAYTLGEICKDIAHKVMEELGYRRCRKGLGQWDFLDIFGVNILVFGLYLVFVAVVFISVKFFKSNFCQPNSPLELLGEPIHFQDLFTDSLNKMTL